MSSAKSMKIFAALVILNIALAFCYVILSGRTFGADLVSGKVRDAVRASGQLDLTWESVRGNPVTGVYVRNAKITSGDKTLVAVDEIEMRVALLTAFSANARLSRMAFSGLAADLGDFSGMSLSRGGGGGGAPVESVSFSKSTLRTPWGGLSIEKGLAELKSPAYSADLRGSFAGSPLSLKGRASMSGENSIDIESLSVSYGDMLAVARGSVAPALALRGDLKKIDVEELVAALPFLEEYGLAGICDASFYITNPNLTDTAELEASGKIASASGQAMDIRFGESSVEFYYAKNCLQLRNASAQVFNGQISGDVDLKLLTGGAPVAAARINAASINTADAAKVFPWMENFTGVIDSVSCDLAGPLDAISAKAELSSSLLDVASFPCSNVTGNIFLGKGSSLKANFLGNMRGAPFRGAGNISIGRMVSISADVVIPKISTAALGANFTQLKDFRIDGDMSATVGIRGPASSLSYNVSLASPALSVLGDYNLSGASAELLYSNNTLSLKAAGARLQDAMLSAEGSVMISQNNAPSKLMFAGKFSNLNIAKFGGMASAIKDFNLGGVASGSWRLSGDTSKPTPSVEIEFPKFFIHGKYVLPELRADFDIIYPSVNLKSATVRLGDSSLSASGNISLPTKEKELKYNVKGSFHNINPATFKSMGLVSQDVSGNLTGDVRVWKTAGEDAPSVRLFFKDSDLSYDEYNLSLLNGTASYSESNLRFDKFRTNLNNGSIQLDGTVENVLGWQKPESVPLNLKVTVTSADIDRTARIFNPSSKGFQGLANGAAIIKGNLASPMYSADGNLRSVRAFGVFLPAVYFSDIKGDKNRMEFPKVKALAGRGFIDANGSVDFSKDWDMRIKASGTSVDIRSLTGTLQTEVRRAITGALDFNFEGSGQIAGFKGKGHGRIPNLSVYGLKLSDVNADLLVSDGFVYVEDSSAKAYGGKVAAQMAKDLNSSAWSGNLDASGADMASLFHDLAPDSEGSITGKANFSAQFAGNSRRTSMQDGNGKLEIFDGEISGFDGAKAVSKMIGGNPLRFHSALISFSLDSRTIYLIPGSRISAPQEDPVYKYVTLDGSVTTEQEINLSCMGNVNIRALNALVAGVQGALTTAVETGGVGDTSSLLKNFLGNTITGFSKNEFRDVSMNIAGKPGDISFSNVSVAAPVKADLVPPVLKNPDGYKEDKGVKLKVEIPVGPGGESHKTDSVGSQIGGQILDQLIKGLIFDGE